MLITRVFRPKRAKQRKCDGEPCVLLGQPVKTGDGPGKGVVQLEIQGAQNNQTSQYIEEHLLCVLQEGRVERYIGKPGWQAGLNSVGSQDNT